MLTAIVHFETRQAECSTEYPRPQIEPSTESVISLEREDQPHDTTNKQYSRHKTDIASQFH